MYIVSGGIGCICGVGGCISNGIGCLSDGIGYKTVFESLQNGAGNE